MREGRTGHEEQDDVRTRVGSSVSGEARGEFPKGIHNPRLYERRSRRRRAEHVRVIMMQEVDMGSEHDITAVGGGMKSHIEVGQVET